MKRSIPATIRLAGKIHKVNDPADEAVGEVNGVELLATLVGEMVEVAVGKIGLAVCVAVAGPGVEVAVVGGVTCKSIFCPGWMMVDSFIPFHAIRS